MKPDVHFQLRDTRYCGHVQLLLRTTTNPRNVTCRECLKNLAKDALAVRKTKDKVS